MSVLVTDAEVKQSIAITQSLGRKGIDVSCVSPKSYAPAFYSKYCKEHFVSPVLKDKEKYIDFLVGIVKNKKYNLLITCGDIVTEYISEARNRFLPYVRIALPDHESLELALDKDRLMKLCEREKLPMPETYYLEDIDDLERLAGQLQFPVVVKSNRGTSARHIRYTSSKEDLINAYNELKSRATHIMIQEYVDGDVYAFYGLCDSSELVAFFICRALRSYPVTGGTPAKAISVYDVELKELAVKIVKKLNWHGMLNLDFIKDRKTGTYKLLEINPRFAGTTSLAISSGVDFPVLLYDLVVRGKKEKIHQYEINKKFRSLFKEEVLYALDRPKDIPKMLFELFNPFVSYGMRIEDLLPTLYMIKSTKWEIEDRLGTKVK